MGDPKLLGQKKSKFIIRSNLSLGQNFLAAEFFLFIDILLKLQHQILICFCKFSCNYVVIVGLLRLLS